MSDNKADAKEAKAGFRVVSSYTHPTGGLIKDFVLSRGQIFIVDDEDNIVVIGESDLKEFKSVVDEKKGLAGIHVVEGAAADGKDDRVFVSYMYGDCIVELNRSLQRVKVFTNDVKMPACMTSVGDRLFVSQRDSSVGVAVFSLTDGSRLASIDEASPVGAQIAVNATTNELFVVISASNEIKVFSLPGADKAASEDYKLLRKYGNPRGGNGDGEFDMPYGVAVKGADLIIGDGRNCRLQFLDAAAGTFKSKYGEQGREQGEFDNVGVLRLDAKGRLFVANCYNRRIEIFDF